MTYIERDFKEAYIRMKERALESERDRDALVVALKIARARIDYLGAAASDERHYLSNRDEYLPRIDAALAGHQ